MKRIFEQTMKTRNTSKLLIAFFAGLLALGATGVEAIIVHYLPLPLVAQLSPPADTNRIIGTLEMLLTQQASGPGDEFQAAGQVALTPPPDSDMPYAFGEIVRYDGLVVIGIGDPMRQGNETFFTINAVVAAEVANEMRLTPTNYRTQVYTADGALAAQGTLQFGPKFIKPR